MIQIILIGLLLFGTSILTDANAANVDLPNLKRPATGTDLGGGKYGLDVSLPPGAVTVEGAQESGDPATVPGDKGLTVLGVRKDSAGALVNDGEYTPMQFNSNGELKVTGGGSISAVGTNGAAAPTDSIQVGGNDGTNLRPISVDASGNVQAEVINQVGVNVSDSAGNGLTSTLVGSDQSLDVNVTQSVLPAGAATETTLSSIDTKTPALSSGRVPVDVQASVLPTGAATSAIQTDGTQRTMIVNGANTPVTINQANTVISGTDQAMTTHSVIQGLSSGGGGTFVDVKVNPAGKLLVEADISSSVLPTGAATETTLSAINGKIANDVGAATGAVRVVPATGSVIQLTDGTDDALITGNGELLVDPTTIKSTAGSAVPSTGVFIMGSDGTDARPIKTNVAGELVVGVTQSTPSTSTHVAGSVAAASADANTAPANCRGFSIFTPTSNGASIRVRYGSTDPTTSSGIQMQPGRSIDFVPACPTIRVISESGTNAYEISWFTD